MLNFKTLLALVLVSLVTLALMISSERRGGGPVDAARQSATGDLSYMSFYGGVPAGIWDEENFEYFLSRHPSISGSFEGNNLYAAPVHTEIHNVLARPNPPDVISSFVKGVLREYVQTGQIADLSAMWRSEGWDQAFPNALKRAVSFDGKPYFVPQAIQWNPIFYQKSIFNQVGLDVPTTWEEVLSACEALSEAGFVPFVISANGWHPPVARWFSILNLRLNGPQFHEQVMRGEVSFTDARIREVFEYWSEMFAHNCFAEDSAETTYYGAIEQLIKGQGAMYNLGEWIFEMIPVFFQPNYDFFAFPEINPDVERAEIAHIYGAFVLSDSVDKPAARELFSYLGSEESQRMNAIGVNRLMGDRRVDERIYWDLHRKGLAFISDIPHLVPLFEFNTDPAFAAPALDIFVEFWKNPAEIDGALNTLESARLEVFGE